MDREELVKDSPSKIWNDMVCLGRPYHLKFFKVVPPQTLLGSFLNTLSHIYLHRYLFHLHKFTLPPTFLENHFRPCLPKNTLDLPIQEILTSQFQKLKVTYESSQTSLLKEVINT